MARIYPMFLIIASLVLLVLPGVLFNTYGSVGFKTTDPGLTCGGPYAPGQLIDVTCQGSVTEGCQAVANDCTLTTSPTLSFLNQNSPFTQLISGNIFGVWGALTSNGNVNRGPFDPNGGGQYYTADCFMAAVPGGVNMSTNSFSAHIASCTQTNPDGSNMTKSSTFTFANWNSNFFGSGVPVNTPFYQLKTNATFIMTCQAQGFWYVTGQPTVGYALHGCDFYQFAGYTPPQQPSTNPIWSFLVAIPGNQGGATGMVAAMQTGNYHLKVFVQPETWETKYCSTAFLNTQTIFSLWYSSQNCVNFQSWFTAPKATGGFNVGFFTPFLTLLIGIVLFLIGTGINLAAGGSILGSGTQFGVGTNDQGTRMAQILGLALIVWAPLYSEFATWFTSGLLPFGLDGSIISIATGSGIIAFCLTGLFFAGVLWQLMSIE